MAVDPRAVSVFVVATEEAELEVRGALLAIEIGTCRFVHEWSPSSLYMLRILHCKRKYHVSSGARSGSGIGNQTIAHQFVTLCRLVCGSAGVARRHASRTSSLVTVVVTR